MMHGWGFGGFGWIGMVINLVFTIGLFIGVILLIVWLVRNIKFSAQQTQNLSSETVNRSSPLEILEVRYARGEIDREQFQMMKDDLSSG